MHDRREGGTLSVGQVTLAMAIIIGASTHYNHARRNAISFTKGLLAEHGQERPIDGEDVGHAKAVEHRQMHRVGEGSVRRG
jgi:hypothetical protein